MTMSPRDERTDLETELRTLFDASVDTPPTTVLNKLRARAVDVPLRTRRGFGVLPRWAWAPSFAALFALVGGAAALAGGWNVAASTPSPAPKLARVVLIPIKPASAAQTAATPRSPVPAEPDAAASPVDQAEDEDSGELAFETLDGARAEENLDAWLYATKVVLEKP